MNCPACNQNGITIKHRLLLPFKIKPKCNLCLSCLKPTLFSSIIAFSFSISLLIGTVYIGFKGASFWLVILLFLMSFLPDAFCKLKPVQLTNMAKRALNK